MGPLPSDSDLDDDDDRRMTATKTTRPTCCNHSRMQNNNINRSGSPTEMQRGLRSVGQWFSIFSHQY